MLTTEEQKQYNRHIILDKIGEEGQLKLKNAKVLVVGAGGLGCPVLQYLTAAGVGVIGVIDDDMVSQSNLQRQVLFSVDDLGKSKVTTAINKLSKLNPFVNFIAYNEKLTTENVLTIFTDFDIIVDTSDNFQTRYLTNDATVLTNKPLVYGAIFKFEGQISVFNYKNSGTYRCLYPNPPKPEESPNCSEIGVLGVLPGIIGAYQANEVIKIICEIGTVISNKLLIIDTLTLRQLTLSFKRTLRANIAALEKDYDFFCGINDEIIEISHQKLKKEIENYNLLDVREVEEREEYHIGGIHIPLGDLANHYQEIPTNKPIVVYCRSGNRSKQAISFLTNKLSQANFLNLTNGISN